MKDASEGGIYNNAGILKSKASLRNQYTLIFRTCLLTDK